MLYLSTLLSASSTSIVDLSVFKRFVRQTHSIDDTILPGILVAATSELEAYTATAFSRQLRLVNIYGAPDPVVEVDMGPVISVENIQYLDPDGVLRLLPATDYVVSGNVITPAGQLHWPDVLQDDKKHCFRVKYWSGIVDTSKPASEQVALDGRITTAIMLLAQVTYDRNVKDADTLRQRAFAMLDTMRAGLGV